jgi:hypothetical protein
MPKQTQERFVQMFCALNAFMTMAINLRELYRFSNDLCFGNSLYSSDMGRCREIFGAEVCLDLLFLCCVSLLHNKFSLNMDAGKI